MWQIKWAHTAHSWHISSWASSGSLSPPCTLEAISRQWEMELFFSFVLFISGLRPQMGPAPLSNIIRTEFRRGHNHKTALDQLKTFSDALQCLIGKSPIKQMKIKSQIEGHTVPRGNTPLRSKHGAKCSGTMITTSSTVLLEPHFYTRAYRIA